MADSSELPQSSSDDVLELNKNLERMIENVENISGEFRRYLIALWHGVEQASFNVFNGTGLTWSCDNVSHK